MKRAIFIFLLPALTALVGCGTSTTENMGIRTERIDSVELVRTGELSFVMDEETSPNLLTTFYDENNGYYYIHNSITGYIERFHTDSTVKSPVRIKTSGMPWGINVVSTDSIYLLDLYNYKIKFINRQGALLNSYAMDEASDIMPGGEGLPYQTPQGLVYTSRTLGEPCLIVIDEKTGLITDRFLPYPEIYSDFYGELLMRTPYSTYNDEKSLIAVRDKKPKPLGKGRLGGLTVSPEKEIEYFREITSYGNILYDRWNNVYYRIVEKSTPMPGVNLSNKAKKLAVMILDEDFRTIGESDITEEAFSCFRYTVFVSPEGMNIQMLTGEDELVFATYSLKEKE